eukprot:CAMPEP_0113959078 /NCGR_PEP_ID=MMETSP0011_2-20120614/3938_1 /TAXON_ID=101924 /ORGANISM="Rhodosorus marinus" /LENGTH=157 /DNA_ID=CAMNT_0000970337 /DNA_START=826 /DNA_END=1300 /DNA_ORIENTATION=- /assembly_acc=CAM_ASM_000156
MPRRRAAVVGGGRGELSNIAERHCVGPRFMRTVSRPSYEASNSPQVHPQRIFLTRVGHTVEVELELPISVQDTAPPSCIQIFSSLTLPGDAQHMLTSRLHAPWQAPTSLVPPVAGGPAASAPRLVQERRYAESTASLHALSVAPTGSSLPLWKVLVT